MKTKKFDKKKLIAILKTLNEEQRDLFWKAVWATPEEEEFFFLLWVDECQSPFETKKRGKNVKRIKT